MKEIDRGTRADSHAEESFLQGGGELGDLIRGRDWQDTPLGPPASWPRSLKTAVRIMLTSRQPIWVGWGDELTYLYNDAYRSILGGRHPEALGRPLWNVWPELEETVGPLAEGVILRDKGVYVETQRLIMERHGYPEETYYTYSFSPIPRDDLRPGGLICANTDETRRVIGERQIDTLRELAERMATTRNRTQACRSAIEALGENHRDLPFAAICEVASDGGIRTVASSWDGARDLAAALLESDAGIQDTAMSVAPIPPGVSVPAGDWPEPPTRAVAVWIQGTRNTDSPLLLVAGLSPYRQFDDSYRTFLGVVAGQIDSGVSHAEAYEQERLRAEGLARLDQAKTAFFSNVSHEFRTPLTLMLGPLEETIASGRLGVDDSEQLEVVHRNGLRLLKLVNTLLEFTRVEAGGVEPMFRPTDLTTLTSELASHFASVCEQTGLTLDVDCDPPAEAVFVDSDMWEQIVFNLLSNAFKFTLEGGIRVTLQYGDGEVELSVRDTGAGIPQDEIPHLFERFHRVEDSRGRSFEGTGIGLSLVKDLVGIHHGRVWAESTLGEGSAFRVALPLGSDHLPAGRIGDPESGRRRATRAYVGEALAWLPSRDREGGRGDGGSATSGRAEILVADDNADMREYLRKLLGSRYDIRLASDGQKALDAARDRRPDLILSDVMMPVMSGPDFVAALRAEADLETVPVILLSARAGAEARTEGVAAGADDYLSKPFGAEELLARVDTHLELARTRREREERLRDSIREHELTQEALREEAQRLETLNALGGTLVAELDLQHLLQTVTDVATELSGAAFGAFFYNVEDEDGDGYMLYTLSGAPREAFEAFGMPRKTALFGPTFDGEGPVRIDDVLEDQRYGLNEPHSGMPRGHLPVRSYLAVSVVARDGSVLGGLFFGHPEPGVFTDKAERVVVGLASQASVAIENTRLHDQREQLIEQLREADRRKDDFLAMLGHELRNPLAAIRGATDLIGILAPNDERLAPAHGILDRQTVHVSRLIDGLLEVSRISLGKISLEPRTVDLRWVVRSVLTDHRDGADGKDIRLVHDPSPAPLWISGDPVRLTQIFDNLVSNAIRFSERGGTVSVALQAEGDRVLARVRDEGVGIRPEHLVHIFEPFHQEVQELARTSGGLGLGLALVRSLVEMHGGSVEARSEGLGRGAEFHVAFPRTDPSGEASEAPATAEIPPLRILLVEDSPDLSETLQLVLEADGHEARAARSGSEAFEILASYDPDVILCDLGLPGMSGYEIARKVREEGSSVPMVALTGYGQPDDRARTFEAGFDHHLVKPVDVTRLRKVFGDLDLPRA